MKAPKVLVGCPTSDHKKYCLSEYLKAIKALSYENYDLLLVDNSEKEEYAETIRKEGVEVKKDVYLERARERIVHSRNILRKKVLEEKYDYFLSLEQDVIPPKDVIEQLLKHGKKAVTGVYFTKYTQEGKEVLKPLLWKTNEKAALQFVEEKEIVKPQLLQITASGLGCILISKEVLKKIKFRLNETKAYDDMSFCEDLHKQRIPLYADTNVKCKHLISGMKWENIKE